ncbi:PREDICTED: sodium/hydrogen exchanger 10-like isoform X2 [Nicrophorus vespilloides]|uniref:Sodium/hydrogen exchanger 10-like isoform X2 n=1 Tax=Nicrophorus vespilloides TaxID=110193 RepID=A0ABM1MAF7_NICVS|nr:PREDICTED: sodium/hydrogen exchanger 10-like isoform X2 [Nicrophorus vespilloides]
MDDPNDYIENVNTISSLYRITVVNNWKDVPAVGLMALGTYVIISIYLSKLATKFRLPITYKFILLLVSIFVTSCIYFTKIASFNFLLAINPRVVFALVHPLYILKIGYGLDVHLISRVVPQVLLLSTVGLGIFSMFIGATHISLGDVPHMIIFIPVFGFALGSIDNLETINELKEFENLRYILVTLETECVMGNAMCLMLLQIFFGVMEGSIVEWYHVICVFLRYCIGGILFGILVARKVRMVLVKLFDEMQLSFLAILLLTYFTYFVCEYVLYLSGPLATFIVSVIISVERTRLTNEVESKLNLSWDILNSILEYILYIGTSSIIFVFAIKNFELARISEYFMMYVASLIGRFLCLMILMPFLVNIGHSIKYKCILAIFWLAKKGSIQMLMFLLIFHHSKSHEMAAKSCPHTLTFIWLSLLINGCSTKIFLRTFGLTAINRMKKTNMNNCIKFIEAKKKNFIAMMKTDRFLSDVNWQMTDVLTTMDHPYEMEYDEDDDDDYLWGTRQSFCADCRKEVVIEPTRKEVIHLKDEAKIKVLKTLKISFIRQHEKGLLSTDGMRPLLLATEIAMDAHNLQVNITPLLNLFTNKAWYEYVKEFLLRLEKHGFTKCKKPRNMFRKICYKICMNRLYEIVIYLYIIATVVIYSLQLKGEIDDSLPTKIETLIFFIDFILKVMAFSHIYIKEGVKLYFQRHWNKIDFFILVTDMLSVLLDELSRFKIIDPRSLELSFIESFLLYLDLMRTLRLLKLVVILYEYRKNFIQICENLQTARMCYALDIGQAVITSCEEVLKSISQITGHSEIRKDIEIKMKSDKRLLLYEIINIHKSMPWVPVTVKSKKAMRIALNAMKQDMLDLKSSGMIDDSDFNKLKQSYEMAMKTVVRLKSVPMKRIEEIYYEVPWLWHSHDLAIFMFINSTLTTFEAGDIIIQENESTDMIYVIIEGFARLKYSPKNQMVRGYGALPIKDYIQTQYLLNSKDEILIPGNSVGELATLTNRPSNCEVVCETAVKAFMIPSSTLHDAISYHGNTKNSLFNDLWMFVSIHLSVSLLWETQIYKNFSKEDIYNVVMRAFIPDLSKRKSFIGSDRIKDILLIEGVVEDIKTNNIYYAPCFLPRSAQKLILKKDSERNIETKLVIIPVKSTYIDSIMSYREASETYVDTEIIKKSTRNEGDSRQIQPGILKSILKQKR